jgi:hypothetical protein
MVLVAADTVGGKLKAVIEAFAQGLQLAAPFILLKLSD